MKTKGELRLAIRKGLVTVNYRRAQPDYRVRKGDIIIVPALLAKSFILQPVRCMDDNAIVYEDRYLLIVNKPPCIVVHSNFSLNEASVLTDLHARGKLVVSPYLDMTSNIIHRIDKYVSGLVMVCRNYRDSEKFREIFKRRQVYKEYCALASGKIRNDKGIITLPLRKDARVFPSRMVVDESYFRPAYTEYRVIQRGSGYTYCTILIQTGRTHQIRVHFQAIGHPILGDVKYGCSQRTADDDLNNKTTSPQFNRIMLHARRLQFRHPFTGELIDVTAPLPLEFEQFMQDRKA